jgi:hypothetical protein
VKGRCYVIGVNPAMHADQIPADFPTGSECGGPTRKTRNAWSPATR